MNKDRLEYEMSVRGVTRAKLCEVLGISRSAFYRKCNGGSEFTQGEIQKIVDFLNQISRLDALINRLLNTVATERSRLTSIGCELKQDKVQTSGPKNSLEETICKIDELERTINARIDELVDLKNTTMKAIRSLPDFDQQNVLIARYIDGKKWLDIAFDLNFSISQVYKIHGKALISFSEKNPNLLLSLEQ